MCILLNINLRIYYNTIGANPGARFFRFHGNSKIDFKKFEEVIEEPKKVRKLRFLRSAGRNRAAGSEKYNSTDVKVKKNLYMEFKKVNWLSDKYLAEYGLRKWTWRVVIDGIVKENVETFQSELGKTKTVDHSKIELLWYTFLDIAGIKNLDSIPNTRDFDSADVKAAMYMYSMESFLYKRMNKVAIDKFAPSIKTLGPFSVLISKIIEKSNS